MIVSASYRLLFIHVQKTGGMTVDATLRRKLPDIEHVAVGRWGRHGTMRSLVRKRPEFADYFYFGFVRNPWSRMYSWHSMIMRRDWQVEQIPSGSRRAAGVNLFMAQVVRKYPTFEAFVLDAPDEFRRLRTPQLDYLRVGRRRADFIGRTENLAEDLQTVFRLRDLPPIRAVPQRNRSRGGTGSYRDHYTPAMRRRVEELFAADIEEFGYEF